jgi:hypothetical protein
MATVDGGGERDREPEPRTVHDRDPQPAEADARPGGETAVASTTAAAPLVVRRAVQAANSAVERARRAGADLARGVAAGDYAAAGQHSFTVRSIVRRALHALAEIERTQPDAAAEAGEAIAAARSTLAAVSDELGPLLASAPELESPDAGAGDREAAWRERVASGVAPEAVARDGVRGPAVPYPHRGAIERSFGRSLDAVAHVGGDAAPAARAIGADAFALGNQVGFASEPSLFVAAHEAAHTMQSSASVHRFAAEHDPAEDPHEAHANAVASRVVRGESAADLLDGDGPTGAEVVRRHGPFDYERFMDQEVSAATYVRVNAKQLYLAVKAKLVTLPVALPTAFASFVEGPDAFLRHFIDASMNPANRDYDQWPAVARAMVRPEDFSALIDRGRIIVGKKQDKAGIDHETGPVRWHADVALPLVDAIMRRLKASLARLMPRYLAARCGAGVAVPEGNGPWPQPDPDAILASHPCDWVTIQALCRDGVIDVDAAGYRRAHDITAETVAPAKPAKDLGDPKRVRWDFVDDPKAPNLIVIQEPRGATVEQVATHFFGSSQDAYRFVGSSPPYFALPMDVARDLRTRLGLPTPFRLPFGLDPHMEETTRDGAFGILRSGLADEVALQQASADGLVADETDRGSVLRTLERSLAALTTCRQLCVPLGMTGRLAEPIAQVEAKLEQLATAPESEVERWAVHAEKQGDIVMRASLGLDAVDRHLTAMGIKDAAQVAKMAKVVRQPLEHVARGFVDAAVLSRLVGTAEERLATAEQDLELAPLTTLEMILEGIRLRLHSTKKIPSKHNPTAENYDLWRDDAPTGDFVKYSPGSAAGTEMMLRDELTTLRAMILAHDPAAGKRIQELYAQIDKLNTETEVGSGSAVMSFIMERYSKFFGDGWVVLVGELPDSANLYLEALKYKGVFDVAWGLYVIGQPDRAEAHIKTELGGNEQFKTFLQRAFDHIDDVETKKMIAKIATMVGIVLISMGAGALAEGGALALGAGEVGAFVVSAGVEAATFTALDATILGGDDAAGTLIGDFAQNLATFGLLRAWRLRKAARVADDALAAARLEGATRLEKVTGYLLKGKELTAEGLIIAATSYAQMQVDAVRKTGKFLSLSDIRDMGKQGLAMVLGIAIGGRLFREQFDELRKIGVHIGDEMLQKVDALKSLAKSVEDTKRPELAVELVRQDRALIEQELALHGRPYDPTITTYPPRPEVALEGHVQSLDAAELTLALDEVVPGRAFMGTPDQLEPIVTRLREKGAEVKEIEEAASRRYEVVDGKRRYVLHEARHYSTTRTGGAIAKQPLQQIEPNSVVGHVASLAEGRALLRRLVAGDRTALAELDYHGFPDSMKTSAVEWGLGRRWDGAIAVVLGSFGEVDWGKLPHIRPMSHTHPFTERGKLKGKDGDGEVSIDDLGDLSQDLVHLFPSAADISLMARAGIRDHHVHTPFVARGGDRVGNPKVGDDAPTVDFVIEKATYVGRWQGAEDIGVYKAKITARAGGKEIWSGTVWAVDAGYSMLYKSRPPISSSKLGPPGGDLRTLGPRVEDPVPGLYDSIDPNVTPPGWTIKERSMGPDKKNPGYEQVVTDVWYGGEHGWLDRSYNPQTKHVIMNNIFLDKLPRQIDAGTPLVPGKGTPTQAYLTMRHMKMLQVPYGQVQNFKMSTIQNIEAVMQLEALVRGGLTLEQAVIKTHSVTYATTSIQQSGHEISKIGIDTTNTWKWKLEEMMDHFQMDAAKRADLFKKYGLGPNDKVLVNYDINIEVGPHPKNPPP